MEQENIERLERRRYRLIFWQTLSFGIWFAAFLAIWLIADRSLPSVRNYYILAGVVVIMLAWCAVFAVSSAKLGKVTTQIISDPRLRTALNNELYLANDRKAGTWGYYITLCAVLVMFILSIFFEIPAKIITGVLLLIGALSAKVAQLILHRD